MAEEDGALWAALLSAQGRVADRIDRDLNDEAEITLAEFEVLDHLAAVEGHTIRMNELADRVRLSPSGLTRRFDTLVRRGWVTRQPCDDDRRGHQRVSHRRRPGEAPHRTKGSPNAA